MLPHRDVREGIRKPLAAATRVHRGDLQVRVWQARRDVMNDTDATEDQEQPASSHERKARSFDRDPSRRTSSRPADICSAPTEAGHMTAADQIVRSVKKVLAMEGRPHMTAAMILSGSAVQVKGCDFWLCSSRKRLMAAWRSATDRKTPRFSRRFVSIGKNPSTALSQDAEVGVKWKVQRGWRASHWRTLGCLCVA
jgi:hypothetical protein